MMSHKALFFCVSFKSESKILSPLLRYMYMCDCEYDLLLSGPPHFQSPTPPCLQLVSIQFAYDKNGLWDLNPWPLKYQCIFMYQLSYVALHDVLRAGHCNNLISIAEVIGLNLLGALKFFSS